MKIEVYQEGGFAGKRLKVKEVTDREMTPVQINNVLSLINESDFYHLEPEQQMEGVIGADLLIYEMVIYPGKSNNYMVRLIKSEKGTALDRLLDSVLAI